ncbi:DUF6542 domain-containing protein [Nocardioides cheoyonin]|uniref:DUF6542 domain-containing protein n=1 Tax=Nocardioides cheoyonin TaxID=3156615 RepID=UPI0032B5501A
MTHARTIWEEGREPGRRVVALGVALALTVAALDLELTGRMSLLFDVVFVALSVGVALLVHPRDFFTVGVLPPLLMVGVFLLLGLTRPDAIADAEDGVVQAVVSGLGHHSISLFVGYALCLGCLAMRRHVVTVRAAATADLPRDEETVSA